MASKSNKKAKLSAVDSPSTATLSSVIDCLDDGALRAILVRTCAADHNSLRQTCKRFCKIVNSFSFRQERGVLGYAEVQAVKLRPPFEQYLKDYGEDDRGPLSREDSTFQKEYNELGRIEAYGEQTLGMNVFVDGQKIKMEYFCVHLLPRHGVPFFSMCDNISRDLQILSVNCFSNMGCPQVPSLKAAVPTHDRRPLL